MSKGPIHLSAKARQTPDQPISYFIKLAIEDPNIISLAAGLVDQESLPAGIVADAAAALLAKSSTARAALQYGTTQGYAPFRDKLLHRITAADHIAPREIAATPDDVIVTTGSEQLLYLVGELLLDPGDIVITEAPSYFVFHGTLESMGARSLAVPMDGEGMITDALAELLARLERTGELERVRLIYVCDYFQNPTGLTLSLARRRHLLDLVRKYSRKRRLFILEDAAYRDLRYDGADIASIKSMDDTNSHVILAMTFSKPCAPGLKTGYGLFPRELVAPVLRLKGNHDFGSNNLTQHVLDRLLETGAYDRHVVRLRQVYRAKRDALVDALAEAFGRAEAPRDELGTRNSELGTPNGNRQTKLVPGSALRVPSWSGVNGAHYQDIRWTRPEGGLYVWLTFPPGMESGQESPLMQAALREGVLYVPGQLCYVNNGQDPVPNHEARLCFGVVHPDQIPEAIRRLARAVAATSLSPDRTRAMAQT